MLGDALCDFTRRAGGGGGGGEEEREGKGEGGGGGGGRRRRCRRALLLFRRLLSFSLRAFGQHPAGGMEPAGGYGAGKAGGVAFDPVAFFTHPRTVLRLMSWVSLPITHQQLPPRNARGVPTAGGPPAPPSSFPSTPSVADHSASVKTAEAFYLFFFISLFFN